VRSRGGRIALETVITAVLAFLMSLPVLGPLLSRLDVGWAGGDMLSTYVNSVNWNGFAYSVGTQFGFPLGMDLNYFPGIDITENTFAMVANALFGSTLLGVNLLIVLSFPLVAALAYLTIRMTGLQGPLAIAMAVAFTFIPYHWGRALGHTYLSTLYSAVIGLALVLLVGSGHFRALATGGSRRRRAWFAAAILVMVVTVAWTGVYYVAFTLILGAFALVWRFAHRASPRALLLEAAPFAGIGVLAAVGFLPALLTLRADPPLASLGERLPYESVIFAGNLAMALLPLPQSTLPGLDFYNRSVVEAIQAAPYGESTVITNHGTWITSAALLVLVAAFVVRSRRPPLPTPRTAPAVTLGYVGYLIVAVLLFFVPWGLNYLLAGTVTAQIRGWNRLLPILLLLFLLGAAVALRRTRLATRPAIAVPIALVSLALVTTDSVLPFRDAYAGSVAEGQARTDAARAYATAVNAALPQDCGVLQLPYMAYPEFGVLRGINDYDHFWTSITNDAKEWSYGAVKNTDASIWAAQLPQVPSDEQVALLRGAGFCAIHFDTRGFISEALPPVVDNLTQRFGPPVATGNDGTWQLYSIGAATGSAQSPTPEAASFLHQPLITPDDESVAARESELDHAWWWTTAPTASFTVTPTSPDAPLTAVSGTIGAPACGPLPVTVTLAGQDGEQSTTVIATPDAPVAFSLALGTPTAQPATLTVSAPGTGCPVDGQQTSHFAQVRDLSATAR
jgi:hypothetical protein